MFGDPASNAMYPLQLQTPYRFRMEVPGSPQDEFISLQDVDEARVAPHHRRGKLDHFFQEVTKRDRLCHPGDYTMQMRHIGVFQGRRTSFIQERKRKRRKVRMQFPRSTHAVNAS